MVAYPPHGPAVRFGACFSIAEVYMPRALSSALLCRCWAPFVAAAMANLLSCCCHSPWLECRPQGVLSLPPPRRACEQTVRLPSPAARPVRLTERARLAVSALFLSHLLKSKPSRISPKVLGSLCRVMSRPSEVWTLAGARPRSSSGRGPPLDLTSLLPAAGAAGGTPPEAKIFGAFYVIFTGVLHALLEHLVTSLVR